MSFGNGHGSGNTNTLYFASGINDEADGVLGSVTFNSVSTATAHSSVLILPEGKGPEEPDFFLAGLTATSAPTPVTSSKPDRAAHPDVALEDLMTG